MARTGTCSAQKTCPIIPVSLTNRRTLSAVAGRRSAEPGLASAERARLAGRLAPATEKPWNRVASLFVLRQKLSYNPHDSRDALSAQGGALRMLARKRLGGFHPP